MYHQMYLRGISKVEIADAAGNITRDPETAHTAVGDPEYQRRVPSCFICQAEILAEAEAEALAHGN